jgi:hypothetical protein
VTALAKIVGSDVARRANTAVRRQTGAARRKMGCTPHRRALAERDDQSMVSLHAAAAADTGAVGHEARSGEQLAVGRVVAVPALTGPALDGLPHDGQGSLAVDEHGRVHGAPDVGAAGDVTSGAIKHGSRACRQADRIPSSTGMKAARRSGAAPLAPAEQDQRPVTSTPAANR